MPWATGYTAGYDAAGNVVTQTNPIGAVSTRVYDSGGRVVANVNPLGNVFSLGYDAANRAVSCHRSAWLYQFTCL